MSVEKVQSKITEMQLLFFFLGGGLEIKRVVFFGPRNTGEFVVNPRTHHHANVPEAECNEYIRRRRPRDFTEPVKM